MQTGKKYRTWWLTAPKYHLLIAADLDLTPWVGFEYSSPRHIIRFETRLFRFWKSSLCGTIFHWIPSIPEEFFLCVWSILHLLQLCLHLFTWGAMEWKAFLTKSNCVGKIPQWNMLPLLPAQSVDSSGAYGHQVTSLLKSFFLRKQNQKIMSLCREEATFVLNR